MCGVVGMAVRPGEAADRELLRSMTRCLEHRGPDAEGLYVDREIGLGHRRLSIIDVSEAANQPMADAEQSTVVVLNGEIYNFQALRRELEADGHRFRTRSDTEVVLEGWKAWGPDCLRRFRGMFALAVWDRTARRLFLARDRLGKKPLYYAATPRFFGFASEIKALRKVPELSSELDLEALGQYAAFGHTVGERSIYREIRRLCPGHWLFVDLNADRLDPRIGRYWSVEPAPDDGPTEEEWLERLDEKLSEAVRLRMISDVPLGAFLSGGIDSSLVVAYMARHSEAPVRTFTMAFGEASHDESRYAAEVARRLGTEHREQRVSADSVTVLETLLDVYDEPFADESAIPTLLLSKMTREHVTVALSGDGGDESFLGYRRYPYSLWGHRFSRLATPVGRAALRRLVGRLEWQNRLKRPLDRLSRSGFDHYDHAMGTSEELLGMLRREVRRELAPRAASRAAERFGARGAVGLLDRFAAHDLDVYLPDDLLVKVDRASMHHSLEVRCPLLDHELVELAATMPDRFKLRGFAGKLPLRRLLRRWLPAELIERKKQGFGVPLSAWFRGEAQPLLEEMVRDTGSTMWRFFDREAVAARREAHLAGRADLHASLWRALYFYRWCRRDQVGSVTR